MSAILSRATLNEQAVAALRTQLRGQLVGRGDANYEEARKV
jgi:hypothetical protein